MVWAGFCSLGPLNIAFITCRMNAKDYQDVLEDHLISFLQANPGRGLIYQQDNASIHACSSTRAWFKSNNITVLDWPSCSPDLNPMENLWGILVRKIYKNGRQFQAPDQLKKAILKAWDEITPTVIQNLISSMPNRLMDVIASHGGPTRY